MHRAVAPPHVNFTPPAGCYSPLAPSFDTVRMLCAPLAAPPAGFWSRACRTVERTRFAHSRPACALAVVSIVARRFGPGDGRRPPCLHVRAPAPTHGRHCPHGLHRKPTKAAGHLSTSTVYSKKCPASHEKRRARRCGITTAAEPASMRHLGTVQREKAAKGGRHNQSACIACLVMWDMHAVEGPNPAPCTVISIRCAAFRTLLVQEKNSDNKPVVHYRG